MDLYMQRCFELALRGAGNVSPNPMVGAVLVYNGRVIGEGWHQRYGQAHAEVNCIASVPEQDRHLISGSTLYCNLEPCFHFGKTPPCVDLILREQIPAVVICNTDPNPLVAGQSIAKMRAAGIRVTSGMFETEGAWLNRFFFHAVREQRPYIILKWAQTANGYVGLPMQQTAISGPLVQRLVHRWRSEADAILVGGNTALTDNPRLDNRYYPGPSPLRIAFDRKSLLPPSAHLLDDSRPTWILGPTRPGNWEHTTFVASDLPNLLNKLHREKKHILFVEGGPTLHQYMLEHGLWDEIRVIESNEHLNNGLAVPPLPKQIKLTKNFKIGSDTVRIYCPLPA